MSNSTVRTDTDPAVVRAALYVRVSTEEQAQEGASIEAQLRALRDYASARQMVVVEEYADEGFSATTDQRPQFQRMIATAKSKPKPFDVVLVHKQDRFARNREHAIVYKNLLRQQCSIDVVSIQEPFEDSPQGRLMEAFMEAIAEFYSANLGQEVRKGLTERARKGEALGLPPFGYRIDSKTGRLTPIPELVPVVRWIFEAYDAGSLSMHAIARVLRGETGDARFAAVLPPLTWVGQTIHGILRNESYVGTQTWNKRKKAGKVGRVFRPESEWIKVEGAHEAIIDRALFKRVQERLDRNRGGRRTRYGDYLWRGLVKCAACGGGMSFMRASTGPNSKGVRKQYDILICTKYASASDRHLCYRNTIKVALLEEQVLSVLRQILEGATDPSQYEWWVEGDQSSRRQQLLRAQEAVEKKFQKQLQLFEADLLTLDEFRTARERITSEREQVQRELAQLDGRGKRPVSSAEIGQRVKKAMRAITDPSSGTIEGRRAALEALVAQVSWDRRTGSLRVRLRA